MKYLIAGNGPAAVNAVKAIRELDRDGCIVMVSPENNEPYSRITVPEYMAGEIAEKAIYFVPGFYARFGVETRLGKRVVSLEPEAHIAVLDDGEQVAYDKLLIATGSRPFLPDWADLKLDGIYSLWNKVDAERIAARIKPGDNAVIAGAGLVAFQAARALNAFGMPVTLVARREIMSRQLDARAAEILKAAAESHGVRILLHTSVEEVHAENGAVTGVTLTNGETVRTNCLLACMGTLPNLDMLEGLLECGKGVSVDDTMKTALPDVYAAGDVASARMYGCDECCVRATWPNAVAQGEAAGKNMAGERTPFPGSRAMNSIELFGVSFISAGQTEACENQREIIIRNTDKAYHKVIMEGARLKGMTFAGEVQQAGTLVAKMGDSYAGYIGTIPEFSPELIRE
ncbi:MAG: NAD(P)/FAD-dependent oxidoreductase [Oscillospiraceae bacterium]